MTSQAALAPILEGLVQMFPVDMAVTHRLRNDGAVVHRSRLADCGP
jgi:hypothetical protein